MKIEELRAKMCIPADASRDYIIKTLEKGKTWSFKYNLLNRLAVAGRSFNGTKRVA